MANIRVDINYPISDGLQLTFKAPCPCNEVTGLVVYYPTAVGSTSMLSKTFTFKDSHCNDLTGLGNLFTKNAYVKVVLDTVNSVAYIQNADTNAYLENKFNSKASIELVNTKADKPTVLTKTLGVGDTSITLTSNAITPDSVVDVYTSVFGVNPIAVELTTGNIILTFEEQDSNINIRVEIR